MGPIKVCMKNGKCLVFVGATELVPCNVFCHSLILVSPIDSYVEVKPARAISTLDVVII